MESNYYNVLGIANSASTKEIRSAYRKLARRFHPDINPNNQVAAARFKEIQIAYDVLGNDEKKKKYDIIIIKYEFNIPFGINYIFT